MRARFPTTLLVLATSLAVSSGCTHMAKVKYDIGAPHAALQPCPVTLRLSKEFCDYKNVKKRMGDSFVIPLGPALTDYAAYVARNQFGDVEILKADLAGRSPRPESKLILEPKVAKSSELLPGLAFQDLQFLLVVDWAILDPKTQRLLLLMPVEASCVQPNHGGGFTIEGSRGEMASKTLLTLTTNTLQQFDNSSELKRISAK